MLIITGLFRSGTTLTQKIIDSHPNTAVVNQGMLPILKLIDNKITSVNQAHIGNPLETGWIKNDISYLCHIKNIFINKEEISIVLDEVKNLAQSSSFLSEYPGINLYNALKYHLTPCRLDVFFQQIEQSIRYYRGANTEEVVGFKELFGSFLALPIIDLLGNDIKIVQVIRDPRSILASRNFGKYSNNVKEQYSVYLVAEMWRKNLLTKLKLEKLHPSSFRSLRYEDLVKEPESSVVSIDNFLGIEFNKSQVDPSLFKDEYGAAWKANTSFSLSGGFGTESIDRWKNILPEDVVGVVEYMCFFEMLAAGYTPLFREEESQKLFQHFTEDERNIRDWIKRSGFILDEKKKNLEEKRRAAITANHSPL